MSSNVSNTTEHTHTHNVFDVSKREREMEKETQFLLTLRRGLLLLCCWAVNSGRLLWI